MRIGSPFLTSDWLARGYGSADAMVFGYPMLRGLMWPYGVTTVLLYRRQLYPGAVGDWRACGLAQATESTIGNASTLAHGATTGWEYTVAKCYPNGYRSDFVEPVRVDFDAVGAIITPSLPTWPRSVDVTPGAAGVYVVSWIYEPWGQGAAPTDFQVYEGADVDSIDYNSPLGTTAYDPGMMQFQYTTGAYGTGTLHAFAVRARNSGGVAERNEFTTEAVPAEAGTPGAATIAYAGLRAPEG